MSELGNEAWEFLFGELKGDVPEVLTDDVLNRLAAAIVTALEAASSTPDGEADSRTWFELREPGCVPERKGPMPPTMVAGFLRELFEHRPQAYVTVITMGQDGPLLQDGPECLQMIDGRSMNVGRRAIENQRAAHGAHPAPIKDGVTVKALSWEKHNLDGTLWTSEVSVTGEYMVKFNGKTWEASVRMLMVGRDYADSEAAKTACQGHHAGRVLSCLSHNAGEIEAGGEVEIAHQPVQEPVAWRRMNPQGNQSTGVTDTAFYRDQWIKEGSDVRPLYDLSTNLGLKSAEKAKDEASLVLVPMVPTDAMLEAGSRAINALQGTKPDDAPLHHPAQNSSEIPTMEWWEQWIETAEETYAAMITARAALESRL